MRLYVSTKEDARWFGVGEYSCVHCEKPLDACVVSLKWESGKEFEALPFCHSCVKHREKLPYNHFERSRTVVSLLPVQIVSTRPPNVRVWVPFPPDFSVGRLSTFEAADPRFDKKMNSDSSAYELEDHTVHASRSFIPLEKQDKKLLRGDSDE